MSTTIDFGIDLGTTNSSIAVCRRGEVRTFQTTDLMNVTPSVVYVSKTGRKLVGKKAYDTWVQDPQNTQAEFKRWMGFSDKLTFPASGQIFSAEDLSAEVLKSVRADAERQSGDRIDAAVITVPAAFGGLQCEATGRAARLAGIDQAPLLQEPIAAAVAYGATPASRDQRWMVFDLGGGTLDIAIVSTRNGQLAVLEHQGNNRLGGKDIDRLIADEFLLKPLRQSFNLPDSREHPEAFNRLIRALIRHAEQAKISLSSTPQVTVEVFDIGDDLDGKVIEANFDLARHEVDEKLMPIIEQCLTLARLALEGARLSGSELDRILLVGGPTQTPIIRTVLLDAIGATLDHSLDPMTVVAQGAALYASTLEKTTASAKASAPVATTTKPAGLIAALKPGKSAIKIDLAFERASGTLQSPVAGLLDARSGVKEVKIDAAGGFWTSGWVPVVAGCFQVDVMLNENKPVTSYSLTARTATGDAANLSLASFEITYMLPMAAPPLPHTIAIELSTANGVTTFDPVFKRHCPLPAEARRTYKTERALRPSELEATLPIKFWEVDVSEDPQEKWWAGSVHIRSDWIKRPIPEGSDIDLTIKIDASRKMTVELFIPLLSESLNRDVYVPDPPTSRSQLQQQIDLCFQRLDRLQQAIFATDREELIPRFEQLQERAEEITEQLSDQNQSDPDAAMNPTESLRRLRVQIGQLEEQLEISGSVPIIDHVRQNNIQYWDRVFHNAGTESEQRQFRKLYEQYERYVEASSTRGTKWAYDQMWYLFQNAIKEQAWYWKSWLENLKAPGRRFLNREKATQAIADAEAANSRDDLPALRESVNRGKNLLAPDDLERVEEQEAQSGLKSV